MIGGRAVPIRIHHITVFSIGAGDGVICLTKELCSPHRIAALPPISNHGGSADPQNTAGPPILSHGAFTDLQSDSHPPTSRWVPMGFPTGYSTVINYRNRGTEQRKIVYMHTGPPAAMPTQLLAAGVTYQLNHPKLYTQIYPELPPIEVMADKEMGSDRQLEHVATNASDDPKAPEMVEAQQVVAGWVEGTEAEKKLKRKLDWRILPCTWVLYLLGYLDRSNVG